MARTFIGLFDTHEAARQAAHGLRHMGVPEHNIRIVQDTQDNQQDLEYVADRLAEAGLPEEESGTYLAGITHGKVLVLVSTDDFTAETAYDTLRYHNMTDVNQEVTRKRMARRERDAQHQDPRFTPSETVEPSAPQKWDESNKLLTATGGVAGSIQGAAMGGILGGPAGLVAGAALGGAAGALGGAAADATFEAIQQEDAVHQEDAAQAEEQARQREANPEDGTT